MADKRELLVKINGDASGFKKAIGDASSSGAMSFGKMAGAVAAGQAIFAGVSTAIHAAAGFIEESVKAANESENAFAQLQAVLKSTSGAAGITSQAAIDLSKSLQRTTSYSDEAVLGAENMLLTFTKIGKDVFPDTTRAVLDMATAMHTDLQSTAIQVGKALQDPIRGVTALQRVGVRLSDSQKTLVENLVKTGQTAKAQQVILKELQTEFGGSAEAAGKTFAGQLERLKNQFNDLQEVIGGTLIEAVSPFVDALANFVSSDQFAAWADRAQAALTRFMDKLIDFIKAAWPIVKESFKQLVSTMRDWVIPAFDAVKDAIVNLHANYPILTDIIGIIAAIGLAFQINPIVTIIAGIIIAITLLHQHWSEIVGLFQQGTASIMQAIQPIMPILTFLGQVIWNNVIQPLMNLAITIWTQLFPALQNLWNVLAPILLPALKALGFVVGGALIIAFTLLAMTFKKVIDAITTLVGIFSFVINVIAGFIAAFSGQFNRIPDIVRSAVGNIRDILTAPFRDAFNTIKDGVSSTVQKLKDLNPFQRHSPSLVDLVTAGTREVSKQYGQMYSAIETHGDNFGTSSDLAATLPATKESAPAPASTIFQPTIQVNLGMYAGQPIEKRQIAVDLWRELVREARSQGVQLPQIGANIQ